MVDAYVDLNVFTVIKVKIREGPIAAGAGEVKFRFRLLDTLKPNSPIEDRFIRTASDTAACGIPFNVGERWVIFANYNSNGKLTANSCGGSRHVTGTQEEQDWVDMLRNISCP